MTLPLTRTALEVFAPLTVGGQPRGANMGEVQTWGTEIEYLLRASAFDTEAEFAASSIPAALWLISTGGYYALGDGGGHLKKRIATPGTPAPHQKQAGDGSWWEIVAGEAFNFLWFGGKPDYDEGTRTGTDNTTPWANFIGALGATLKDGYIPAGAYFGISAPGTIPDAAAHNVAQVGHSKLVIRGAGSAITQFVAKRAATTAFPGAQTSRPMLKSVGATHFEMSGITLDGGFRAVGEIGGSLGTGADPQAASLLEVRSASRVKIDDVVLTGFAGNWDNRTVTNGNYGRRGPLLLAACTNIEVDLRLQHPTFREGPFVHDCVRGRVGLTYNGPSDTSGSPVSTPLHVMGPNCEKITIGPFRATGAWRGSVCNVGGKDSITVRDVEFEGKIGTTNDTTGDARTTSGTDTWGKGFDFGAEHQEAFFAGHPKLGYLVVEGFTARSAFSYALRGIKQSGTRGGHAKLSDINIYDSFEGVNFEEWERVDFDVKADRVLRYIAGSSSNGYALRLVGVDRAFGDFKGHGGPSNSHGYPNATTPAAVATVFSRFGILLQRTNAVIKATTFDFRSCHILFDVDAAEDNTYSLSLDIEALTQVYTTAPEAPSINLLQLGRSGSARLKSLKLRGSINGATLVSNSLVTPFAVASNIA